MQKQKRYILFVMIMAAFCLVFSGCRKEEKELTKEDVDKAEGYNCFTKTLLFTNEDSRFYELFKDEMEKSEQGVIRSIVCGYGNRFLIEDWIMFGRLDEAMAAGRVYNDFYFYDSDLDEMTPVNFDGIPPGIYNAQMNKHGEVFLAEYWTDIIYKYNEQGEYLCELERGDLYQDEEGRNHLNDMACDDEYLYLKFDSAHFRVLDRDLNLIYQEDSEDIREEIFFFSNRDGSVMLGKEQGANRDTWKFYDFDLQSGLVKKKYPANDKEWEYFDVYSPMEGDEAYDFYFESRFNHGYLNIEEDLIGIKDGKASRIFSAKQMGFEHVPGIHPLGNGSYFLSAYNRYENRYEYYRLNSCEEEMDYSPEAGKEKITIAALSVIPMSLSDAASAFNYGSENYSVEFRNYSEIYEDIEEARTKFNLDLTLNKDIDGVLLYGMDKKNLAKKGVLLDLQEYLAGGHEVKQEDFLPNLMHGLKDESGSIYAISPEFQIEGFVSKEAVDFSHIGLYKGLSSEGKVLFADSNAESMLTQIVRYSGKSLVDPESGETHFDENFMDLLAVLREGESSGIITGAYSGKEALYDGRALAFCEDMMGMPEEYLELYRFFGGADFYCSDMGSKEPSMLTELSELGITAYSPYKDGMYEFLDFIFKEENYRKYFGGLMFYPALNRSYEEIPDMTREEAEAFRTFIESAEYAAPLDTKFIRMINEETQYYFNGSRSAEETCRILENRVSTAVKERMD